MKPIFSDDIDIYVRIKDDGSNVAKFFLLPTN